MPGPVYRDQGTIIDTSTYRQHGGDSVAGGTRDLTVEERELASHIRTSIVEDARRNARKYMWKDFDKVVKAGELDRDYSIDEKEVKQASISEVLGFFGDTETYAIFFLAWIPAMVSGLIFPALAFIFSDSFTSLTNASNDMEGVNDIAITFLGLGAFAFTASFLQTALFEIAASRASRNFMMAWFHSLLRQDLSFFDVNEDINGHASILIPNAAKLRRGLGKKFGEGVQFATCTVAGLLFAFYSSWRVSLVIICLLPVLSVTAIGVSKIVREKSQKASDSYQEAGALAYMTVSSIKTIFSLNAAPRMIEMYEDATQMAYESGVKDLLREGFLNGAMLGSFIFLYMVLTLYGSYLLYKEVRETGCDPSNVIEVNQSCSPGGADVFSAMLGVAFAGQGMSQISGSLTAFANARAAIYPASKSMKRTSTNSKTDEVYFVSNNNKLINAEECSILEDEERFERQKKYILPRYTIDSSSRFGVKPRDFHGEVKFENILFAYPTRPNNPVFNGRFNLTIPAGKTVALVGPSGGGKSTVVSLLERFYDPQKGSVSVDGNDLRRLNIKWLRDQIGYVGQEPVLFKRSIADNIRCGCTDRLSFHYIQNAAKMANADEFIKSFPDEYSTQVGDKGAQLSGGQKQRIAIARALVKEPKILILDEATSALDTESEMLVQKAIENLLQEKKRTTIIIAHRLTTIRKADFIAYVEDGEVQEIGTHDELMQDPRGKYRFLVDHQGINTDNVDREEQVEERISQRQTLLRKNSGPNLRSTTATETLYDNNDNTDTMEEEENDEARTRANSTVVTEVIRMSEENQDFLQDNIIKFQNVSFSYPTRPEKKILRNFSLNIKKGETLALVGPSGGGKSTVVSLVERFYDPTRGSILFQNIPLRRLNLESLRDRIGYVGQEPVLFNGSIAENIIFGYPAATSEQIVQASKKANAHDFITSFPHAYETHVGDNGTQISGGQKQRIALARALVKKPSILILDEATSALDSDSERVVQHALNQLMRSNETTTIVIAHRLSTIKDADRIAFISQGRVKEIGTHDELMSLNGLYTGLVSSQTLGTSYIESEDPDDSSDNSISSDDESNGDMSEAGNTKVGDNEEASLLQFDKSWATKMARHDTKYIIFGSIGVFLSGIVFPAWGILFGLMIKILFTVVLACSDEMPIDGLMSMVANFTSFDEEDDIVLDSCQAYWDFVADDMREKSFYLAAYWGLIVIVTLVGYTMATYGFNKASAGLNKRMRDTAFTALMKQSPGFFDMHSTGELLSQLEEDTAKIHAFTSDPIRTSLMNASSLLIGFAVSLFYMWPLPLITLLVIPFMAFAASVDMKQFYGDEDDGGADNGTDGDSPGAIVVETLSNMKTVCSLNLEPFRFHEFRRSIQNREKNMFLQGVKSGASSGLSLMIQQYVNALQFWFGGYLINKYPDRFDFDGFLIAMFSLLFSLFALGSSSLNVIDKKEATDAANRIYNLVMSPSQIDALSSAGKKLD